MSVFRADYLELDIHLVCSSLGQTVFLTHSLLQSPIRAEEGRKSRSQRSRCLFARRFRSDVVDCIVVS